MRRQKFGIIFGMALIAILVSSVGSYVGISSSLPRESQISVTPNAVSVREAEPDCAPEAEPLFEPFEATAYCDYGITFSGVLVQRGIVAADPSILPIGSVIEVLAGNYSGIYTVMDTGGLVKGQIIDIYMPDYEEAIEFGRQQVRLRVIRNGWGPEPVQEVADSSVG